MHIFVRDRQAQQTTEVSINSQGVQANDQSYEPHISADGRFVVFSSFATNLVAGDINKNSDIFIHDRLTKQTTLISVDSNDQQSSQNCVAPQLSDNGQFVSFYSASPLDSSKSTGGIFVRDLLNKTTTLVSVNSQGEPGYIGYNPNSSISADGRFIVFASSSPLANNAHSPFNVFMDVFIHDRILKTTTLVNSGLDGTNQCGQAFCYSESATISADGRFVGFTSDVTNLVANDTNDAPDTFVWDRLTHKIIRASVSSSGEQAITNLKSVDGSVLLYPNISSDGSTISFVSSANNLVAGTTSQDRYHLYVHNLQTHQTNLVTVSSDGLSDTSSPDPFPSNLSADGRYVVFSSNNPNLIPNGPWQNGYVYLRDRLLDTTQQANLKVAITTKPASLTPASTGAYTYTVTNSSAKAQPVNLLHLVSKGVATSFRPSQGTCRRYATTSLCKFGSVPAGKSVTLKANVKVNSNQLRQKVVVSASPIDPVPANNSVNVTTAVK